MKNLFFLMGLLLTAAQIQAVEWYKSDPGGVARGLVIPGGKNKHEWMLSVEREGDAERRNLYQKGLLMGYTLLIREDGILTAREERAPDGTLITRTDYSYAPDGSPLGMHSTQGEDTFSVLVGPLHADLVGRRESSGEGGSWNIRDFDENGGLLRDRTFIEGALAAETLWKRNSDGVVTEEVESIDDVVRHRYYDVQGRLITEIHSRNGWVFLIQNHTWSGENLVMTEERGGGGLITKKYFIRDGRVVRELQSWNGKLEKEILSESEDSLIETYFSEEKPVLRLHWKDEKRTQENLLLNDAAPRSNGTEP